MNFDPKVRKLENTISDVWPVIGFSSISCCWKYEVKALWKFVRAERARRRSKPFENGKISLTLGLVSKVWRCEAKGLSIRITCGIPSVVSSALSRIAFE